MELKWFYRVAQNYEKCQEQCLKKPRYIVWSQMQWTCLKTLLSRQNHEAEKRITALVTELCVTMPMCNSSISRGPPVKQATAWDAHHSSSQQSLPGLWSSSREMCLKSMAIWTTWNSVEPRQAQRTWALASGLKERRKDRESAWKHRLCCLQHTTDRQKEKHSAQSSRVNTLMVHFVQKAKSKSECSDWRCSCEKKDLCSTASADDRLSIVKLCKGSCQPFHSYVCCCTTKSKTNLTPAGL